MSHFAVLLLEDGAKLVLEEEGLRNNENASLTLQKKGLLERVRLLNQRKF